MISNTPILCLNVSGREYKIRESILNKIPYFHNMLETCNDNEIIFVDRSNVVFDQVISFVIDEKHPFPIEYSYELDFYDIKYDIKKLYDPYKSLLEKYDELNKKVISNTIILENGIHSTYDKINKNGRRLVIPGCVIKNCKSKQLETSMFCDYHNNDNRCIAHCGRENRCTKLCENNESFCNDHINKYNNCNKEDVLTVRLIWKVQIFVFYIINK